MYMSYQAYRHLQIGCVQIKIVVYFVIFSDHKMSYYDVILQPKQCKCFPFDQFQTVFCNRVSNWSVSCTHVGNGMHEDV